LDAGPLGHDELGDGTRPARSTGRYTAHVTLHAQVLPRAHAV